MKPKHRRAVERQRINFRVFRDFRGSSFSLTILLSFALLLAASPAPAQSSAILLDIKSPATASPPNESLLTLDEEGNLWIKGHLYDYAFQSTITLDPAKKYWILRDSTGKILWALEVHNPATGVSTGDLYSIGSFEGWAAEPDQTGAILRYTNASPEVVFTLSAAGEARARRTAPQRDSAAPYPTVPQPPAIVPDTPPTLLTYPLPEAEYASLENKIIPKPFAQGRFFYNPTDNSVVGEPQDVTDIPWRRRWDPAKASLQAYGARIGSRYQNIWHEIFGSDIWAYNPAFSDQDGMVFRWTLYGETLWLAYMGLNPIGEPTSVAGIEDSSWTISSISCSPSFTSARPQAPDDFSVSMSNNSIPGWDPAWGATLDPATSAKSRLFRYWIEFDEKRKASAVPHKAGDPEMNVRCRIVPQNLPPGWINHIELTIWDPAYPNQGHKRVISGPSGQAWISTMWDGKLYENGVSGTPYYTQASDVLMEATVYWNQSSPSKPWETESDTFQELRLSITAPVLANYGNRFVFNEALPGECEIHAKGTTGDAALDAGLTWTISAMNGSTVSKEPATGPDVTIKYTTLPPNITDFGFKTITLSHPSMPGVTTTAQVEIYFRIRAKNWPGASPVVPWYFPDPKPAANIYFAEDNAYHYYSQAENAGLNCPWRYDFSQTNPYSLTYPPYFQRYVPFIGPLGSPPDGAGFTKQNYAKNGVFIKWANQELWGINLFAWAARHEMQHHNDWETWYGAGGMDPRPEDADSDMIRDPFEPVIPVSEGGPYLLNNPTTHDQLVLHKIDGEAHAEFTHATDWELKDGIKNEKDWGYPGARWR